MSRVRCILQLYSLNFITTDADLHESSQIEDEEVVIAEIAKLVNKMEHIYERQYQAERQTRAVAKRSASESKWELNENVTIIIINN